MQIPSPFRKLKTWIEAVDFGETEQNQISLYIHIAALLSIIGCAVLGLNYTAAGFYNYVLILGINILVTGGVIVLIRQKHLGLGRVIFLFTLIGMLSYSLASVGGIHASGALLYPVILIFASLILPRHSFLFYTACTILSIGIVIYAEHQRLLPTYSPDPPEWPLFISYILMIISAAFIARLITEGLQNSLRAAREREHELATQKEILDRVGQAVVACRIDNTIIYWNNAATIYYGWEETEAVGKKYNEVVPIVSDSKSTDKIGDILRSGNVWSGELSVRRRTGEKLPIIATIAPLHDENGGMTGWVGIAADVSALKSAQVEILDLNARLERRVAERTEELEKAYQEMETVSYSTSHNLRSPVRGVTGLANILLRDHKHELSADAQEILGKMQWSALRMGAVIDGLLEFLRVGKTPLKFMNISPNLAAQQAIYELFEGHEEVTLPIEVADMPPCRADLSLLSIVYKQLLDNAIKFARSNDGHRIEVGAQEGDTQIVYFVKDNGQGFDMKYAERIFDIFQQLNPPGDFEGTGAGLAIAQRIIHRHGGQIWAEAKPGEGAAFYFTLGPSK